MSPLTELALPKYNYVVQRAYRQDQNEIYDRGLKLPRLFVYRFRERSVCTLFLCFSTQGINEAARVMPEGSAAGQTPKCPLAVRCDT